MLIANATIVTVDENDRILDPGWIEVTDGRISAVASEPIAPRPGERTIDATGKVVLPGLVNAHTHLFQVLIRGVYERLPFAEWLRRIYACGLALSEADFELGARLGALEALLGGTTTIVEHHFLNGRPDGPSATIAGMRAMGIRTVFAR
ncbi:MAG TPA: amidohydrolase family protein, partial [Candidatus Limnocylindrales bacterium]|nr:amidohydrolase family protein [Candidatus Limnocylindrales bacterium]